MVAKVKFAITHEETRFQLNGALLKVMPSKMEMVATDGHRMALINFPQGNGKKKGHELTILIPRKALEEILRLEPGEDGNVQFGVSENHLFFDAGDRRLLARMIDVNFPNYMEVIARDNDRHATRRGDLRGARAEDRDIEIGRGDLQAGVRRLEQDV